MVKRELILHRSPIETGVYPEFEYPLIKKIIDRSLGVICHSEYGIYHVMRENKESVVKKINQPYTVLNEEGTWILLLK